jgi:hypothetical protein
MGDRLMPNLKDAQHRRFLKILNDLDSELQMLGVRGDWGPIQHCGMAFEVLLSAFYHLSRFDGVSTNTLGAAGQSLIDTQIVRERGGIPYAYSVAAMGRATDKNTANFLRLFHEYRKTFVLPEK